MASFELYYEAEEDVLEVTFESYDERFARIIPLNDHIAVTLDGNLQRVLALNFGAYARLLEVGETEFTDLHDLADHQIMAILTALSTPPACYFLDLTQPDDLVARVCAPGLQLLIETG